MDRPAPPSRPRFEPRAVHGVLLLDKPVGLSSNTAMQRARRLLRAEKAGHTGTLDPLAGGLLPLCFGAATKFAQAGLDADKRYRATLRLGATTTTGDGEGEVVRRRPVAVDRASVAAACAAFVGRIAQTPPMHSALKHAGKPLYVLARAGVEVERAARDVVVHAVHVVEGAGDLWTIDIACSKGTYVRTLAEGIGEALGCGAHLAALRRTASGPFGIAAARSLDVLEALDEAARDACLLPPDALVADVPRVELESEDAGRFLCGLRRRLGRPDAPCLRVYGPAAGGSRSSGTFLGTGHIQGGELIASRLLSPAEVAAIASRVPLPELESSVS